MAAYGYLQAYQSVRHSVRKVLEGANPGVVCEKDHRDWYREMRGPEVAVGIIKLTDLAGYTYGEIMIVEQDYFSKAVQKGSRLWHFTKKS